MGDMRQPTALVTDKHMDAATFAYLSDDTYTATEVEDETRIVIELVTDAAKAAPNPKMFLRTFWYRAIFKGVASADEMHVYILARWGGRSGEVREGAPCRKAARALSAIGGELDALFRGARSRAGPCSPPPPCAATLAVSCSS